jgi:hypothetical protein
MFLAVLAGSVPDSFSKEYTRQIVVHLKSIHSHSSQSPRLLKWTLIRMILKQLDEQLDDLLDFPILRH